MCTCSRRPCRRRRTPGEFERGIALATSALRVLDSAAEPVRVANLLIRRSHFKMKLGRKDYAADLEEALEYVPADVSAATRIEILLALSHCPPKITVERSYAEEALALARRPAMRPRRRARC